MIEWLDLHRHSYNAKFSNYSDAAFLIYITSTMAFNSIISVAILSLNATYVIPQAIVLLRSGANVPRSWAIPRTIFQCVLDDHYTQFRFASRSLCLSLWEISSVVIAGIVVAIGLFWVCGKRNAFVGSTC